jgi:hypothetical protein
MYDCLPLEKNEICRWGLRTPQVGVGGLKHLLLSVISEGPLGYFSDPPAVIFKLTKCARMILSASRIWFISLGSAL